MITKTLETGKTVRVEATLTGLDAIAFTAGHARIEFIPGPRMEGEEFRRRLAGLAANWEATAEHGGD